MRTKNGQQLVQSLERGLTALEMAIEGGVRSSEVAQVLETDRSTAYRLLYTLMAKGYLLQNPTTREFTPNPTKFFQLHSKVATLLDWTEIAASFLSLLRDQSGESANLGVRQDNNVVYIAHKPGQAALSVNFALGTGRPLHCSSLGKVLLAQLPPVEIEQLINQISFVTYTSKTITDLHLFRQHLATVQSCGYAIDDEETFEGVRCIAAPIYDHRKQVIAAVGISGPSTRVTIERLPKLTYLVINVADQISNALGAPGFAAASQASGHNTGKNVTPTSNEA
ncbi:MAG: IclR family transcriptional regulator [Caldilineaceae bacterium]|nr:IclR family transcriptional regulator [Caldilineaceae bacterium]